MKHSNRWIANYIGTLLLLFIFAVGALFLINVGVKVYNNVVVTNNNNFTLRTSLNYVATKIRTMDTKYSVNVGQIEGIEALVLTEVSDDESYDTYIYYYDGSICELLTKRGYEIDLESGFEIVEANSFNVTKKSDHLIELSTSNKAGEEERMLVSIRSEVAN